MNALVVRPSSEDDLPAIADLMTRHYAHLLDRESPITLSTLAAMRAAPGRDPARDYPVVERAGRIVAVGAMFAQPPYTEIGSFLTIDPELDDRDHRACVDLLLDAVTEAALHRIEAAPPAQHRVLDVECLREDARLADVLAELGHSCDRQTHEMTIDLSGAQISAPEWPSGVTARPVELPGDTPAIASVLQEAFADHHGDMVFRTEQIAHFLEAPHSRNDISYLASDEEGPVGAVMCLDRPGTGYVGVLGVARRARGRGLGHSLLLSAFAGFAASGTYEVGLDVDAQSLTGATRLYERAGMHTRTITDSWVRPLV